MLEIGHLRLQLPVDDAPRAEAIARQVAEGLSRQAWPRGLALALTQLRVPTVEVAAAASDAELTAAIVDALLAALHQAAAGARA